MIYTNQTTYEEYKGTSQRVRMCAATGRSHTCIVEASYNNILICDGGSPVPVHKRYSAIMMHSASLIHSVSLFLASFRIDVSSQAGRYILSRRALLQLSSTILPIWRQPNAPQTGLQRRVSRALFGLPDELQSKRARDLAHYSRPPQQQRVRIFDFGQLIVVAV